MVDLSALIINFEGREAKGLSKGRYNETFACEDDLLYNCHCLKRGDDFDYVHRSHKLNLSIFALLTWSLLSIVLNLYDIAYINLINRFYLYSYISNHYSGTQLAYTANGSFIT